MSDNIGTGETPAKPNYEGAPYEGAAIKNQSHSELPGTSEAWAKIVKWPAIILLCLVCAITFLPFFGVFFIPNDKRFEYLLRWGTIVLAPIMGLGGTIVGYYFGSNGSGK